MKVIAATFLMLCLQVAMSPLCLCLGADTVKENERGPCCHVPEGEEEQPCPHCDQEMPIAATAPVKGDFPAEPPEWHGFDLLPGLELLDPAPQPIEPAMAQAMSDPDPPPLSRHVVFGVFLI